MLETPKKSMLTLISVTLIGLLSLCLASSSLMNSVSIRSSGKIVTRILFDKCDQIGEWKIYSSRDSQAPGYNTLVVDTSDKVEGTGSLKGIFAADAPNYGGQFYKSNGSFWNIEATPLLRMWIKINQPMYSAFKLELVCEVPWQAFGYEVLDQLVVGEWREVTVDLRLPDYKPTGRLPDLTKAHTIAFTYWLTRTIDSPQVVWWDNITLWGGPYIPPQIAITPLSKTVMVNEIVSFSTQILGGEMPYSYAWWVNGTLQQGQTSSTFNFSRSTAGKYNVTVVVTDNRSNSGSATAWVTVLNEPPEHPPYPEGSICYRSEVRGVAVGYVWNSRNNHTMIAETLYQYGINTVWVDVEIPYFLDESTWDGSMKFHDLSYHRIFIEECHERGIKVIASFITMMHAPTSPTDLRTLTSTGTIEWLDVTKPLARQLLKAIIQELATKYGFDGINLDYIRWEYRADMPLGNEARDKFIADTGLSDVNWPTDVLSGGRYFWHFMNWRANVITEIVGELYRTAKEANPNIEISVCPWEALNDAKWYWVYYIGQHAADMVDKGYCDFVSPMCYDPSASRVIREVQWAYDLYVGCVEGKYPLIPFLSHSYFTPQEFASLMSQLKTIGIDGWILVLYNGPGVVQEGLPSEYPDIRPYLAALHEAELMEPVWVIQNFTVNVSGNTATISWTTTVPTNATIEYADGNIFYATTLLYQNALYYKDINYNGTSSTKINNSTYSVMHSFTIQVFNKTCFRIICTDENGNFIITSKLIQISEIQR